MMYQPVKLLTRHCPFILLCIAVLFSSCQSKKPDAQQVVDGALAAHGWQNYKQGVISFRQEDNLYRMLRDDDAHLYSRTFVNRAGERVYDVLTKDGFTRTVNDQEVTVTQDEQQAYSAAIRSTMFLALLPHELKAAGIKLKYMSSVKMHGEPYHKIGVVLPEENDNQTAELDNSCLLWIHSQHNTLDYILYNPHHQGRDVRFSKAVNPREEGGIRFQDYEHYTTSKRISPARYDYAFEAGELEQTSETKLDEIKVDKLPPL